MMNAKTHFIRSTIAGGILILFPVVVTIIILEKIFSFLKRITAPIARWMPGEIIFGLDGHNLVAILLLLLLCFFSGLLFRSVLLQKGVSKLEENLLNYVPGYIIMKSIVAAKLHTDEQSRLQPVLMQEGDSQRPGFLVEKNENGFCTVYLPDAPKSDTGEVRIIPLSAVTIMDVPIDRLTDGLRRMGKGLTAYAGSTKIPTEYNP